MKNNGSFYILLVSSLMLPIELLKSKFITVD